MTLMVRMIAETLNVNRDRLIFRKDLKVWPQNGTEISKQLAENEIAWNFY
jgi:hypothetical protein